MIRGRKYFNKDVVYVSWRKHNCPYCKNKLKTVKVSKIVNFHSPEVRDFDFHIGPTRHMMVTGDMKFIWKEFECPKCKSQFTVEQLKKIEGVEIVESDKNSNLSNLKNFNDPLGLFLFIVIGLCLILLYWLIKYCL